MSKLQFQKTNLKRYLTNIFFDEKFCKQCVFRFYNLFCFLESMNYEVKDADCRLNIVSFTSTYILLLLYEANHSISQRDYGPFFLFEEILFTTSYLRMFRYTPIQ